jgi:hypothetical protein
LPEVLSFLTYDGGCICLVHENTPQHRMGVVQKRIEGIVLRQHDGSVKVFDTTAVSKEMFL